MALNLGSIAIEDLKLGETQVDKVCLGSDVVWQKTTPVAPKALKFTSTGAQTLGVDASKIGSIASTLNLEYSNDGETFTTWDITNTLSFGNGTDLYVRGSNTVLAVAGNNYLHFVFFTNSPVNCSGNIMHLYDYTQDLLAFPSGSSADRGVKYLFEKCSALISAPELPATTLVDFCYSSMFDRCSSLVAAPELPATTLAQSCYLDMFRGCTSLTDAPNELPANTLVASCYEEMFYGCSSLRTAPILPAPTLVASAYIGLFTGCKSLDYIKCLSTNYLATCTTNWVSSGVPATGTFVKKSGVNWPEGFSGIPTGWTVEEVQHEIRLTCNHTVI